MKNGTELLYKGMKGKANPKVVLGFPCTFSASVCCLEYQKARKRYPIGFAIKKPSTGLEPATLRLKVSRSTD